MMDVVTLHFLWFSSAGLYESSHHQQDAVRFINDLRTSRGRLVRCSSTIRSHQLQLLETLMASQNCEKFEKTGKFSVADYLKHLIKSLRSSKHFPCPHAAWSRCTPARSSGPLCALETKQTMELTTSTTRHH